MNRAEILNRVLKHKQRQPCFQPKSLYAQSREKVRHVFRESIDYVKPQLPRAVYTDLIVSYFDYCEESETGGDDFTPDTLYFPIKDQEFVDFMRSSAAPDTCSGIIDVFTMRYYRKKKPSGGVYQNRICEYCWVYEQAGVRTTATMTDVDGHDMWMRIRRRPFYCSICKIQPLYSICNYN